VSHIRIDVAVIFMCVSVRIPRGIKVKAIVVVHETFAGVATLEYPRCTDLGVVRSLSCTII